MKPVYITDYLRSAFTRAHPIKQGVDAFENIRADEIFVQLINTMLSNAKFNKSDVEELAIGCALPVKEQWNFGGRYPVIMSELDDHCASRTLEQQCGSGLAAIRSAALAVASGASDLVLAGGYEHMTRVPMGSALFKDGTLTVPDINSNRYDMDVVMNMGLTAEKLANNSSISRAQMDEFACRSHEKAVKATSSGFFAGENAPITLADGQVVKDDGCIRPDTNISSLSGLRSVFKEDGLISAGNSSPLTTGAALVSLMSETMLEKSGATPMAKVIACVDVGVNPELMGSGVVPAISKALSVAGLTVEDIDAWEINEAFSVVPLYAMQALNIPEERVNLCGGALALGHPLGATGIRLTGTLARILKMNNGRYGVASACIGGGQGIAIVIENV